MVTFYALISAANILRIPSQVTNTGTALDFLQYFRNNGHITQAQYDGKTLLLRLVVNQTELVSLLRCCICICSHLRPVLGLFDLGLCETSIVSKIQHSYRCTCSQKRRSR